jgi:hypothetical protein
MRLVQIAQLHKKAPLNAGTFLAFTCGANRWELPLIGLAKAWERQCSRKRYRHSLGQAEELRGQSCSTWGFRSRLNQPTERRTNPLTEQLSIRTRKVRLAPARTCSGEQRPLPV